MNPTSAEWVAWRYMALKVADRGDPSKLLARLESAVKLLKEQEGLIPVVMTGETLIRQNGPAYAYSNTPEMREHEQADRQIAQAIQKALDIASRVGRDLYYTLLQQVRLEPSLRKKVEDLARYYSSPKKFKWKAVSSGYREVLTLLDEHVEVGRLALVSGEPHDDETNDNIKAGPFRLVNTGGFSPKVMSEVATGMIDAAEALSKIGASRVCYGEVYVTNTLKNNTLAFYMGDRDEIYVRANFRRGSATLHTLLHELAHRLHTKFLTSKNGDIERIFRTLSLNTKYDKLEADLPEVGDSVEINRRQLIVDEVSSLYIYGHFEDEKPKSRRLPMKGYLAAKNEKEGKSAYGETGFVTRYAASSAAENFAEMVAFYAMGKLPEKQVEMLREIIG
jgi:hypothetical protein